MGVRVEGGGSVFSTTFVTGNNLCVGLSIGTYFNLNNGCELYYAIYYDAILEN